jgi:hypothetical protein
MRGQETDLFGKALHRDVVRQMILMRHNMGLDGVGRWAVVADDDGRSGAGRIALISPGRLPPAGSVLPLFACGGARPDGQASCLSILTLTTVAIGRVTAIMLPRFVRGWPGHARP